MMRGPEKICCAVRKPDGTIDLSYDTVTTHWYNKVPLVRGVCNMAENLLQGLPLPDARGRHRHGGARPSPLSPSWTNGSRRTPPAPCRTR